MKVTDAGDRAFHAAIEAIEGASAVEVVVAIRPHARRWLVPHAVVAVVAVAAVLAFTLYSDREFALWEILALPLLAGAVGASLVELGPVYRFLAPKLVRHEHVHDSARVVFVARKVHATTGRTGMLVYIAVRERIVELVGDLAVVDKVGAATLDAWSRKLEAELPRGAEATAKALAALAPDCATALPHRADDVNELPDTLDVPRRRFRGAR